MLVLLIPQYVLNGVAEVLNVIASNEFFYLELPKTMSSIAVSLSGLGLGVGSLLASLILSTVNKVTTSGGKESWITNNINEGHYESYYWLLAVLSSVNLLYFLLCCWAYGPCADQWFQFERSSRPFSLNLSGSEEDRVETRPGLVLIWITAMIPQARPPYCNQQEGESCKPPTGAQYAILLFSFMLMSIGAGGIRSCSMAFGADQLDHRDNPNNKRVLEKFFTWYYSAIAISLLTAFTVIVYIQDHAGWKVGFLVPVILMFLSALSFFIASPFYIKQKADKSLLTNFVRVLVVCIKNRNVAFPSQGSNSTYHDMSDSTLSEPTNKLRFLNKACIIRNPEEISPEGEASNAWTLCTVDQVEELKSLIRVIPLWSSSIMMSVNISQGTFHLLQARSMDRHITPGFQLPAGSFAMFTIIGAVIWVIVYDRIMIPLASKIRRKPFLVSVKVRMGVGLFCSFLAMVVAAIVEHYRRQKAIQNGYYDNPTGVVNMSAMLLVPQYVLNGIAEALNVIASNEFFYSELPKNMSSIAVALSGFGMTVGSLLASLIMSTVNNITKSGGKESWISKNINKGHYESYYWLLGVLSSVNLLYFLVCSWAYGPCADKGFSELKDEGIDSKEEELHKLWNGLE
ncbi:hypothetical protein Vadar_029797 [Vaccinium darrowii]|uniref:Uncharacterized protein n=1 Tax=Vaccinium darrowii TaxID=229202 RepID=A0ACB7Z093_9ERIC|nr:hypothetical protein Vadar_029797 [Vaccinium darrowii]